MNKKSWLIGIFLGMLGLMSGAAAMGLLAHTPGCIPPLKVIGDVANVVVLKDPNEIGKLEEITFQGTPYQAAKLGDIIKKARPVGNAGQLHLVGLDGFSSAIKAQELDDCYLVFTAQNGWEAVNLKHPMSSNVKMLTEIVVVSDGSAGDFAFQVIDPAANLVRITPGQLLTRSITEYPYAEGKAVVQNGGKNYESQIFTRRRVFKLSDLTTVKNGDSFLVMDQKGHCRLVNNSGYFEVRDNYINYLQPETRTILEKVKGVIVRPPAVSIMDTYYNAQHYLEGGEKVLIVVLDGLTYHQYIAAAEKGYAPFLNNYGTTVKASGVYPPELNVGLAALLTGKAPEENGIISGKDRQLKAASILAEAKRLKKRTLFLEDDLKQLETEIQPVLITDQNADGNTDEELYKTILANLDKGYALIVARFHGINNAGQRSGELALPTMQAIGATDRYLAEIVGKWPGRVIIAANQGERTGRLAGTEVMFSRDNMIIPYWGD